MKKEKKAKLPLEIACCVFKDKKGLRQFKA